MGEAKKRGSLEQRINEPNFTCIICRKIKSHSERSDEHVIPDSLNGYYHIFTLCITCNKKLGSNVDNPLVNFKLMELYRFNEGIKGKGGNLPNPFKEIHSFKDDPNKKVTVEIIDGKIVPRFAPFRKIEKNEDGTIRSIHISTDARDEHLVDDMLDKILARNNINKENGITQKSSIQVIEKPELAGRWKLDIHNYKIGLLKIAYEFAVDSIDKYFNDPLAIKISKILESNNYDLLNELEIYDGFNKEMFEVFSPIVNVNKKRHLLILSSYNKKLYCMIKLDEILTAYIHLSDSEYIKLEESIIGINDLELRTFVKKTMHSLLLENLKELYITFVYYIPPAQAEINNANFKLIQTNGLTNLFNKDGSNFHINIVDLLEISSSNELVENEKIIIEFEFPKHMDIYVKSSLTGNLFQVLGCKHEQEFSRI